MEDLTYAPFADESTKAFFTGRVTESDPALAAMIECELGRQRDDVRSAGKFAHQNAPLVADKFGTYMFVAGRDATDRVHVHAPFVREGALPHKRLIITQVHVCRLIDEPGELGKQR